MSNPRYTELDAEEPKQFFVTEEREVFPDIRRKPYTGTRFLRSKTVIWISSLLFAVTLITAFRHHETSGDDGPHVDFKADVNPHRIAKVSMLYGDKSKNSLYERALETHIKHGEKWGYPTYIKRENEYCGYWNKPTYMISQVAEELAKPESERMEWLMWVDADSIVLNPNIPAHIFLPPKEHSHIHIVAARDIQGLNTGVFFVRVHPWTISMFVDSMAFPLCHTDIDLGNDADQAAMARTLEKTQSGPSGKGFRDGVVYLPKKLFNSYELPGYLRDGRTDVLRNFTGFVTPHAFEGKQGDFLVHLPGLFDDRAPLMADWLDMVEHRQEDWALPLEETTYAQDTKGFWDVYSDAFKLLKEASDKRPLYKELVRASKQLRTALSVEADDVSKILEYSTEVRELISA